LATTLERKTLVNLTNKLMTIKELTQKAGRASVQKRLGNKTQSEISEIMKRLRASSKKTTNTSQDFIDCLNLSTIINEKIVKQKEILNKASLSPSEYKEFKKGVNEMVNNMRKII